MTDRGLVTQPLLMSTHVAFELYHNTSYLLFTDLYIVYWEFTPQCTVSDSRPLCQYHKLLCECVGLWRAVKWKATLLHQCQCYYKHRIINATYKQAVLLNCKEMLCNCSCDLE